MITPQSIDDKVFNIILRGYSVSEVDDFLQEICDDYTEMYEENKRLHEDNKCMSEAIEMYKAMEATIKDSLTVSNKSAEQIENEARKKADEIISNAEIKASSLVDEAEKRIANEIFRYENIKREIEIYKSKIVRLLNAQLDVLKDYPKSDSSEFEFDTKHIQQLWRRKTDYDVSADENEKSDEAEEKVDIEKTEEIEEVEEKTDVFDCTSVTKIMKTPTEDLPVVSLDENGNYNVSN